MKLTHVNVFNIEIPSFAYMICEDRQTQYQPIFDKNNILIEFAEVKCQTPVIPVEPDQQLELNISDTGLFAYHSSGEILIGDAEKLVPQLLSLAKRQKLSNDRLKSFEAFAKKYGVLDVYQIATVYEDYLSKNDTYGMIKLLLYAYNGEAGLLCKKWAIEPYKDLEVAAKEVAAKEAAAKEAIKAIQANKHSESQEELRRMITKYANFFINIGSLLSASKR